MLPSPIRTSPFMSRMVTSPACRSFTSSSAMIVAPFEGKFKSLIRRHPGENGTLRSCCVSLVAVEGLGFAFVNVEDGQELGDGQQVLKFLGQIKEFQLSTVFI